MESKRFKISPQLIVVPSSLRFYMIQYSKITASVSDLSVLRAPFSVIYPPKIERFYSSVSFPFGDGVRIFPIRCHECKTPRNQGRLRTQTGLQGLKPGRCSLCSSIHFHPILDMEVSIVMEDPHYGWLISWKIHL